MSPYENEVWLLERRALQGYTGAAEVLNRLQRANGQLQAEVAATEQTAARLEAYVQSGSYQVLREAA